MKWSSISLLRSSRLASDSRNSRISNTSTMAFHTIQMPWYFSGLAMYHPEFLAGVLAFMARSKLAALGFWIPFSVGLQACFILLPSWGGRDYVPIALFFLIVGFSNIRDRPSPWLNSASAIGDASYSIYLIHPLIFLVASAVVSKIMPPIWTEEPIRAGCFVLIFSPVAGELEIF